MQVKVSIKDFNLHTIQPAYDRFRLKKSRSKTVSEESKVI